MTSSVVFINVLHERGVLCDFSKDVLLKTLDTYSSMLPKVNSFIYLKRSPEWCRLNVLKRGREGEQKLANSGYLASLDSEFDRLMERLGAAGGDVHIFHKLSVDEIVDELAEIIRK